MTSLPVLLKGILTIEDAQDAVDNGVPGIMLSNHGGRNLDGTPSTLEVALDIHQNAPELFDQIEIYADGGVRYGTDVLKLLALGVKAVGVARPFMFANVYGMEGVQTAIQILKREIAVDAANLGVADLARITADYVSSQLGSDSKTNVCIGELDAKRLASLNALYLLLVILIYPPWLLNSSVYGQISLSFIA